jgi:hypothetical protein
MLGQPSVAKGYNPCVRNIYERRILTTRISDYKGGSNARM